MSGQRVVKCRKNCESGPSRGQLSGFHPPFDDSNVSLSRLPKGSGFHPPYHRGFTHPTIGVSPTDSRGFTHRRTGKAIELNIIKPWFFRLNLLNDPYFKRNL